MRVEPLTCTADPDWLALRLELWPDCPRAQHLEEMASFLRERDRYAQFIARTTDGRGVGLAEASIRVDYVNGTASSPVGYLEGLFVKEAARRQGVARRLVDAVAEWAASQGCAELASDTQPENRESRAMHRHLGFVETEQAVFFSRPLEPKTATAPFEPALATPAVTPQLLLDRLAALARQLAGRDDALALLALGSVGRETDRLDAWSDLDFFVLVREGAKQRYIGDLDWLAAAHPLAWHFRNTADGHKALMTDGVFCEFAVFEIHELARIPYAPGRFVWRRDEVDEALASPRARLPARHDVDWLVGEALSNLVVGLQRHARGERLAAMRMIQVHGLDRVLEFLEVRQAGSQAPLAVRDPFNVDRRIEVRSPRLARELPLWAGGYEGTVAAALALLAALEAQHAVPADVAAHIRKLATVARGTSPGEDPPRGPATGR